ncbi:TonB-dependent receptor [Taylorella equigenitalis]|nr:TonB-dependent receptor [Taylorella equigenitalis]
MKSFSKENLGINMYFHKCLLIPFCVLLGITVTVQAQTQKIEDINVEENIATFHSSPFVQGKKPSDLIVKKDILKLRSATLGNALSNQPGIHSNAYGGGASRPVIRAQEGVRIKILNNNMDVIDASVISPDHVVAADTLLSSQVEILRGTPTLLYASASPAGVINVIDNSVPTEVPTKGYEGEAIVRYNTNNHEKVGTIGTTFALGKNIALRFEGLKRHAENYKVPSMKINGADTTTMPDTYNKSQVASLGLSYISEKAMLGVAYRDRRDKYGIPGHNHEFDTCAEHFMTWEKYWLGPYPHLMEDEDVIGFPHFDRCRRVHFHDGVLHEPGKPVNFENYSSGPWIDMHTKKWDVRGELKNPFAGIEKINLSYTYSNYFHDEKDPGVQNELTKNFDELINYGHPTANFSHKGHNARLEFHHKPVDGLKGIFGMQYQTLDSIAQVPYLPTDQLNAWLSGINLSKADPRHLLPPHKLKQISFFGLEQLRVGNVLLSAGFRYERQHIDIDYNEEILKRHKEAFKHTKPVAFEHKDPDYSAYEEHALSMSLGMIWDINDYLSLAGTISHNERLPSPMELYFHGKHLATHTFEHGNKNLKPEESNNFELGFSFYSDHWEANLSAYINNFENYIFNEDIASDETLYMRRFAQSKARIFGLEGSISYRFNDNHKLTVMGDVVDGKLSGFSDFIGAKIFGPEYECYDEEWDEWTTCWDLLGINKVERPDRKPPRLPPARLGLRWESKFNNGWAFSVDYMHVFDQNKISISTLADRSHRDDISTPEDEGLVKYEVRELPTKGYDLLGVGVQYEKKFGDKTLTVDLRGDNLLNQNVRIHNSALPYVSQMGRNFSLNLGLRF